MQNPFTTTFSKTPEYTYIHTEKTCLLYTSWYAEDDETVRTGIKLFRGGYPAVDQPDKNAGRSHGRKIRKGLHGKDVYKRQALLC